MPAMTYVITHSTIVPFTLPEAIIIGIIFIAILIFIIYQGTKE